MDPIGFFYLRKFPGSVDEKIDPKVSGFFQNISTQHFAGQDPFMFPNQLGGVIVSRGFFDHLTPGDEMSELFASSQGILGGSSQLVSGS